MEYKYFFYLFLIIYLKRFFSEIICYLRILKKALIIF